MKALTLLLLTFASVAFCQDDRKYDGRMDVAVGGCHRTVRTFNDVDFWLKTQAAMDDMWEHGCVSYEDGNIGYVYSIDNDTIRWATQVNLADPDQVLRYDRHARPWASIQ